MQLIDASKKKTKKLSIDYCNKIRNIFDADKIFNTLEMFGKCIKCSLL